MQEKEKVENVLCKIECSHETLVRVDDDDD